ncbi:MAG: 23S rRNA (adenine(2503)-C(2))-methyltransferase RlmN [Bradymonadaceae bacterium]
MERSRNLNGALEVLATEQGRFDWHDFDHDEIQLLVLEGLGQKKFRAQQIYQWLYLHLAGEVDEMTNLSKDLRERMGRLSRASALKLKGTFEASDGTTKMTFECDDGAIIETVYIPADGRNTLCISSQVGCAMGCTFCYTAKMGLKRNLTTAEIVGQVVHARRIFAEKNGHIGNIVFMGMGEPLHNVDNVIQAIHIFTDDRGLNFSRRKVTVSTSGLVPAIARLGAETDIQLAISLNATTDETRSKIMPVNDRWNLETLMSALREFPLTNRERITFEYVLIKDLNDTLDDAQRIIELIDGIPAKVNLIPFNTHPGTPFETPSERRIDAFRDYLLSKDVAVFRRKTRGDDEMAACGQLGKPGDKEPPHVRKRLAAFREAKA